MKSFDIDIAARKLIDDSMNEIVAEVFGKNRTRRELSEAFDLVKDRENWKNPIDCVLDESAITDEVQALISEAVNFFAGCEAHFIPRGNGRINVQAKGYYLSLGA